MTFAFYEKCENENKTQCLLCSESSQRQLTPWAAKAATHLPHYHPPQPGSFPGKHTQHLSIKLPELWAAFVLLSAESVLWYQRSLRRLILSLEHSKNFPYKLMLIGFLLPIISDYFQTEGENYILEWTPLSVLRSKLICLFCLLILSHCFVHWTNMVFFEVIGRQRCFSAWQGQQRRWDIYPIVTSLKKLF